MLRLLALAAVAAATGISSSNCIDLTIPMSLKARNAVFDLKTLTTEEDVTNFYLDLSQQGNNLTDSLLDKSQPYKDVSKDYTIRGRFCQPKGGSDTLQILTHGIGFDMNYWDLPLNNYNYSYTRDSVENHGIATLAYDRLGVGKSSHGEPNNEIQIFLEIAALKTLTDLFRTKSSRLPRSVPAFKNIVHVGHSFGSSIVYNLGSMYPESSQGIILTGFSHIPNYLAYFALGVNHVPVSNFPRLRKQYPVGYVTPGTKNGVQIAHFGKDDFDSKMLKYAFDTAQPNTPGEILTVGYNVGTPNAFPGPVMILTGERDVPFCGGDCFKTSAVDDKFPNLIAASKPFFPQASVFNATIVPKAGHGLSMHYSHVFSHNTMLDFIDRQV